MPGINTPPRRKPPSQRRIVAPRAPIGSRIVTPTPSAPRTNWGKVLMGDFANSPIARAASSVPGSARGLATSASKAFWTLVGKGVHPGYDTYDAAGEASKRHGIEIGDHMPMHKSMKGKHMMDEKKMGMK